MIDFGKLQNLRSHEKVIYFPVMRDNKDDDWSLGKTRLLKTRVKLHGNDFGLRLKVPNSK